MYRFFSSLDYVITVLPLGLLNFVVLQVVTALSIEISNV